MISEIKCNFVSEIRYMTKLMLLILLLVSGMIQTWAKPVAADDIEQLQKEMYQLYNKNDEAAFIDVTFSQTVESHRNGAAPNDDMTMLAIRCRNL